VAADGDVRATDRVIENLDHALKPVHRKNPPQIYLGAPLAG
jgi:hypothetical protein